MIANFALIVAHGCMGYFLWRAIRYEMDKRASEHAERASRIRKARR